MIDHSTDYSKAIVDDSRRQYVRAVFDLVDPDATLEKTESSSESIQSKPAQLVDRGVDETSTKPATLEYNRWALDGTWDVVDAQNIGGQIGWSSDYICDENGNFKTFQYVTVFLKNIEIAQSVTVQFSEHEWNGYPESFVLEIYSGDKILASREYDSNTETRVVFDGFTVNYPDKFKIIIKKWSVGNRRARIIRYLPGLYEQWDGKIIKNVDIYTESTFSGLSIPYSTCTIEVYNEGNRFDPYSPNSIFKSIEDRQAVKVDLGLRLSSGDIEWLPGGTYFQQSSGWELQDLTVKWELLDIVGMLVNRRFVVPETLPTTLGGWVEAIMSSLGINFKKKYKVDDDVNGITVSAKKEEISDKTCGEILRYLCMATQTWPRQDFYTGFLKIGKITRIEGNKITLDEMSSYPKMSDNSAVSDITFKLGKDGDGNEQEITFTGTNTECNQSLTVTNPFIHTEEDARKAVVSCLMEYGGKKISVQSRGNPSSETGDLMSIQTRFSVENAARLRKQQLKFEQGVMKNVPSEFIQNPNDNVFKNKIVLTGDGVFTSPIEGELKITIIQAGTGGTGGRGGIMIGEEDQEETTGGTSGSGGKVFIVNVSATIDQPFQFSCGAGGDGGAGGEAYKNGKPGSAGGETTFGQFSSAPGKIYSNGFMDVSTGAVYAAPGSRVNGKEGSGGEGGEEGEDGYQVMQEDGSTIVYSRPQPGKNGENGKPGCIIVEW